ncbi:MAG: TrmB family transcriptional regulator [Candidatus Woesearchaeota archaeon]
MDSLKKLGLNNYEIAIYKTLFKYSRNNAKKISEYSNVPQTAVYPNLKSLIKKGLVQEIKGEISLFEITDTKIAIKSLINTKKSELENTGKEIATELSSLIKNIPKQENISAVSLSYGVESSHNIAIEIINNAKSTIYIIGWGFITKKNEYNNLRALKNAVEKGIDVRMIINNKESKNLPILKIYKTAGIKIRYFDIQNISIFTSDTNCKITLKSPQLDERFNIYIRDKDMSKAFIDYFLTVWNKSEKI